MKVSGFDLKLGDVFAVNGDRFEVIGIAASAISDSRKVRFASLTTGREYVRLIWHDDTLVLDNV
jgi:hypothetical protein